MDGCGLVILMYENLKFFRNYNRTLGNCDMPEIEYIGKSIMLEFKNIVILSLLIQTDIVIHMKFSYYQYKYIRLTVAENIKQVAVHQMV